MGNPQPATSRGQPQMFAPVQCMHRPIESLCERRIARQPPAQITFEQVYAAKTLQRGDRLLDQACAVNGVGKQIL